MRAAPGEPELLAEPLRVVHVSPELAEQRVYEIDAQLRLVVVGRADLILLADEMRDQPEHGVWTCPHERRW